VRVNVFSCIRARARAVVVGGEHSIAAVGERRQGRLTARTCPCCDAATSGVLRKYSIWDELTLWVANS